MFSWFSGSSEPANPHIIEGLPTPKTDADYEAIANNALQQLSELLNQTEGWEDVSFTDPDGGDIKVQSKIMEGNPVRAARASGTIAATPQQLLDLVACKSLEENKRLEPEAIVFNVVKKIGDNIEVIYSAQNVTFPLTAREALHCRVVRHNPDGSIHIASTSINDENVKIGDGRVRAVLHISGWHFIPQEDGKTFIKRVVQLDPRGSIPTFVVNMYISKVGATLATMRTLLR